MIARDPWTQRTWRATKESLKRWFGISFSILAVNYSRIYDWEFEDCTGTEGAQCSSDEDSSDVETDADLDPSDCTVYPMLQHGPNPYKSQKTSIPSPASNFFASHQAAASQRTAANCLAVGDNPRRELSNGRRRDSTSMFLSRPIGRCKFKGILPHGMKGTCHQAP